MSSGSSPSNSGTLASRRSRNDVPPGPAPTMATTAMPSGNGGQGRRPVPLGDFLADDGDDALAEFDGVLEDVVAPGRQDLDAEVVVVEQRRRHGFRGAHEGVGVAGAAGGGGRGRPQRPVEA